MTSEAPPPRARESRHEAHERARGGAARYGTLLRSGARGPRVFFRLTAAHRGACLLGRKARGSHGGVRETGDARKRRRPSKSGGPRGRGSDARDSCSRVVRVAEGGRPQRGSEKRVIGAHGRRNLSSARRIRVNGGLEGREGVGASPCSWHSKAMRRSGAGSSSSREGFAIVERRASGHREVPSPKGVRRQVELGSSLVEKKAPRIAGLARTSRCARAKRSWSHPKRQRLAHRAIQTAPRETTEVSEVRSLFVARGRERPASIERIHRSVRCVVKRNVPWPRRIDGPQARRCSSSRAISRSAVDPTPRSEQEARASEEKPGAHET